MRTATRVKRHVIKPNHELYPVILETSREVAKLRNRVNYLVMQDFVKEYDKDPSQVVYSSDLVDVTYYYNLEEITNIKLYSAVKQNTIRTLEKEWKSFIKASSEYVRYPNKFKGEPRPPRYPKLAKFEINYQSSKLLNSGELRLTPFLRPYKEYLFKTNNVDGEYKLTRFVPRNGYFVLEIVYEKRVAPIQEFNRKIVSIDIGLDNLLTLTNNVGKNPMIINGKGLKSCNTYYNKNKSHYQSLAKKANNKDWSKRLETMTNKRYFYFQDKFHKISTYVTKICKYQGITQVIIGWNDYIKQSSKLKNFTQIPQKRLIDMLKYKLEDEGIEVILVEESYTSITSFLDHELPIKENKDRTRRVHRGLFISNQGIEINADVNASYQIIKKVYPEYRYNSLCHKLIPRIINVV